MIGSMKLVVFLLTGILITLSCKLMPKKEKGSRCNKLKPYTSCVDHARKYLRQVNVRQYTSEGTLVAFGKNLQRLKDMGVQTLWFYAAESYWQDRSKRGIGELLRRFQLYNLES